MRHTARLRSRARWSSLGEATGPAVSLAIRMDGSHRSDGSMTAEGRLIERHFRKRDEEKPGYTSESFPRSSDPTARWLTTAYAGRGSSRSTPDAPGVEHKPLMRRTSRPRRFGCRRRWWRRSERRSRAVLRRHCLWRPGSALPTPQPGPGGRHLSKEQYWRLAVAGFTD